MRRPPFIRHLRQTVQSPAALGPTLAVAMVAAAVVTGSGTAGVLWAAHGDAEATTPTQRASGLSVSLAAPTAHLYPGGSSDVVLTLLNSTTEDVHVDSLSIDADQGVAGFSADAGHAGCDLSAFTFVTTSNHGLGWEADGSDGGGPGATAVTLPGALTMRLDAADSCQGVSVMIDLVAGQ